MTTSSPLTLYRRVAREASGPVIRRYSSSFGMASALFPRPERAAIASVYALVRIADEIVDGTAAEAGADADTQREILDELEADTERALRVGYSANVVVQAFADVARATGIGTDLTRPFFASMRRDLDPVDFDEDELRAYVHGSAEVVGLMCLRVFLRGRTPDRRRSQLLEDGAIALGAAFQKINFLRDLGDDRGRLGRAYLPGVGERPDPAAIADAITDVRGDLMVARRGMPLLPASAQLPVAIATALFAEVLDRIQALPPDQLGKVRVSVPTSRKLAVIARERARLIGRRR